MAKQNQHIEQYLDAYREMKDTDFAVMITGAWGCGKTWFVKEYLQKKCTSNGSKEHIYISLNGVANTADIDMAIFQAAHPVLGSKFAVTAGKIFKASVKAGLKIDLDLNRNSSPDGDIIFDPSAAISLASFKLRDKEKLLVFDDLERCLLPPEEILGYINAFLESGDAKVVVIGEEDHLNKTSDEKYRIIKEKVIGKTFWLTERIEEVFDDLLCSGVYPNTYTIIQQNKPHIVKLFKTIDNKTKKHNYRALKHALRGFEYFYSKIDTCFLENDSFTNDLLRVFLTLHYEMQLGHFTANDLIDVSSVSIVAKLEKNKEETNLDKVLSRHHLEGISLYSSAGDLIWDTALWKKVLNNEWIDEKEIFDAIKNSSYFPKQQPEWVTLRHWRRVEDADAEKALKDVRSKLSDFEYRTCEVIVHVFSILMGLSKLSAIPESSDEILESAKDYLETLLSKKYLTVPERDRGFHWTHFGSSGLGYWGAGTEEVKNLILLIDEAIEKAVEANKQDSASTWLAMLKESSEEFLDSISSTGKYYREPILKYFQPAEFVDAILNVPNEKSWLISGTLEKRYEMYGKDLAEELPFCEGVVQELTKRLNAHKGCITPSVANLKYLKEELEKALPAFRQATGSKNN